MAIVEILSYAGALPPVASFTISNASPSAGQTVTLTDTSAGTPTSWSWVVSGGAFSFVGGTSASSQNPQIQFSDTSTSYTVNLTVTNADGSDSTSFINNITTTATLVPAASFTISDATPSVGQIVTLTDTSTETPTSWSWAISPSTYVFEGGTSATSQNPQVAFLDESTNYTVNLTATNAGGSDSTAFTNNVVSNALEVVHFEYDPYLYGDADNEGTQVPTTYGSPTYNSAGYYAFDGTDDAFYYDYDNGINDATGAIEAFVDWDNSQDGIAFSFGRDDATSYRGQIALRSSDNTIRFTFREASSSEQIRLDWNFSGASGKYHIVLNKTADGGSSPDYNYELYVNGVSQGNADVDSSTASQGYWLDDTNGYTPYNLMVGARLINNITLPETEFIGDIHRVAVYQDPLSATRISENYNWLLER